MIGLDQINFFCCFSKNFEAGLAILFGAGPVDEEELLPSILFPERFDQMTLCN
jgi:hypothetical protein